jgi:hypothetical protein
MTAQDTRNDFIKTLTEEVDAAVPSTTWRAEIILAVLDRHDKAVATAVAEAKKDWLDTASLRVTRPCTTS